MFSFGETHEETDTITIYENNGAHWRVSKEKKPRSMESVIFREGFIKEIMADIQEFIESEDWYTEMGIPYKRSYLFFLATSEDKERGKSQKD